MALAEVLSDRDFKNFETALNFKKLKKSKDEMGIRNIIMIITYATKTMLIADLKCPLEWASITKTASLNVN